MYQGRYRSGLNADVIALEEVGLETKFHQPDFTRLVALRARQRRSCIALAFLTTEEIATEAVFS
jgi:hypothetical protein